MDWFSNICRSCGRADTSHSRLSNSPSGWAADPGRHPDWFRRSASRRHGDRRVRSWVRPTVRVLLGDLQEDGYIHLQEPDGTDPRDDRA